MTFASLRSPVAALLLITLGAASGAAQPARSLTERLDSIAGADVLENEAVGIVAAVVRGDDTLLYRGYGKANVEQNVPMPTDAIFEVGSITKQFTAAAILQLRDQGKLSLDDDITKWLPDFDTRGNRVPLRRLLDHTSGIPDIAQRWEFGILMTGIGFPRGFMYTLIRRRPFDFPTGTAQIYNNSAFWLLGLIIEKASGMSYERYMESMLFQPLGMTRSMARCSSENVPHRARGYVLYNGKRGRAEYNTPTWYMGSGVLCSSAGDLVTWLQALHGGKVLSPQSYAEMVKPATLNDGTPLRYGMGLQVSTDQRGLRFIGHSGEISGFGTRANWYPDARMAVVVLMNASGDVSTTAVAEELAAAVLPTAIPSATRFTGDVEPLLGRYKGVARGGELVVAVTRTPEGLATSVNGARPQLVSWISGLTFRRGSALLTFRRAGASGPATELRYDVGTGFYILERE